MATYENISDLNKAISSIKNRSKSLSSSIQEAKNGCLDFFENNDNTTPASDLLNAVGKGVRYGALKSLFEQAGIIVNKDKKTKAWKTKKGVKADAVRIEELRLANWEDFKHTDEVSDDEKAKSAYKNAIKWIAKYPELAKEMGLTFEAPEKEETKES